MLQPQPKAKQKPENPKNLKPQFFRKLNFYFSEEFYEKRKVEKTSRLMGTSITWFSKKMLRNGITFEAKFKELKNKLNSEHKVGFHVGVTLFSPKNVNQKFWSKIMSRVL